jgi:hypothetical protein
MGAARLMVPEQRLDKLAGVDGWCLQNMACTAQPGDAKLESVNYWTCSIPDLITREVELMLELQIRDGVDVANGLKSYSQVLQHEVRLNNLLSSSNVSQERYMHRSCLGDTRFNIPIAYCLPSISIGCTRLEH